MATVLQTGFATVLLSCQAQLVRKIPLFTATPTLVLLVARDGKLVPKMQADQDVVLRGGSFISRAEAFDGAGRTCTKFRRYLIMYPRNRLALDEGDRDDTWLTDPTKGFYYFEEACCAALSGYFPQNANQDLLTYEEIRISEGTDPIKSQIDGQWGDSAVTFEVEYLFSLGQAPL